MIFIIILASLIVIGLIIWGFWNMETSIPKIEFVESNDLSIKLDRVAQWFDVLYQKKKFNGIVIYVKDGKILLKKTLGFTSYTKKYEIDDHTMFRLASVSKQFTAFGIMVLKQQRCLSYDDLVTQYISEFPYPKVTIRHLLNHTSGIQADYVRLAEKRGRITKDYILTNEDVITLLNSYTDNLKKEPLQEYFYNNTNYIILAHIISRISDTSFERFMRKEVFEPLGLHRTRVWNLLSDKISFEENNIAEGFEEYLKSKPRQIRPNWIDGVAGDGAIFSCIHDLIKWSAVWEENKLLSKEDLREAFKKPVLLDGSTSFYGFGWVVHDEQTTFHQGGWLASNTIIVKKFKEQSTFIMLDNSSNLRFNKIIKRIETFVND